MKDLTLKERTVGDWAVTRFDVDREGARRFNISEAFSGRKRYITPGTYWKLSYKGECVMSNTPAEIEDHRKFIWQASGSVLIAGLGIGMVLKAILEKEDVSKVVVVEKNKEVIELVGEFYQDKRVHIVNADIYEYKPIEHFDYAWFDIWNYISADTYTEMKKLHLRFRRYVSKSDSWCKKEARKLYDEERKEPDFATLGGIFSKHLVGV